ncbi:MAG: M20 family metallopeptidase [Chloroflexi bacterium]|nr:M20 family metallopeptidase [Chloroflexota bacterium]MYE39693.1 M20 family metallopeptidase [Chloroflexota bacterium]
MANQYPIAKDELASRSNLAIEASKQALFDLSKDVHAHPELNYEEYYSSDALAVFLESNGLSVERGIGGMDTAFRATIPGGGGGGPTIAVLAEYDALPEIGHGCGHNLIAMAAMGAALGLQANASDLPGRVVVIGTPAEEGGGGKIRLLDAGVFDGVDATLSSHPFSNRTVIPAASPKGESWSLAMVGYRYMYHGKAAHAAAYPEQGINALNAVIHLFTGIDALRQHLRDDVRIHGVITDGGTAPNVVPEFAAANFMLRSRDGRYLSDEVVGKVRQVAEGAAAMTGSRLEIEEFYPFYENVQPNVTLAQAMGANAQALGMKLDEPIPGRPGSGASTDFGNVSQAMPGFELRYAVSETPVPSHTRQMQETAVTDLALNNALLVAKTLSLTASDLLLDAAMVEAAKAEYAERGG